MDKIVLPQDIFGVPVRPDILQRVVTWHLACKRQGTASVKTRAQVAGSGRKIAPQKGMGIARVGSRRSPIRRGGGKAHGPKPRDWHFTLPKKVRQLGLKCALSSKFAQNKLFIIDQTDLKTHRTRSLVQILHRFKWTNALFVEKKLHPFMALAHSNIPKISYITETELTVYDILNHEILALHRNTLPYLATRLGLVSSAPKLSPSQPLQTNPQGVVGDRPEDYDHIVEEGEEEEGENENFDEFLRKEMEKDKPV